MGFWRSFLKEWLSFSRSERQGIVVLIFIIALVAIAVRIYPERTVALADPSIRKFAQMLNEQLDNDDFVNNPEYAVSSPKSMKKPIPLSLHSFDPNLVSAEELSQMGLPPKFSKSLLAYRTHGGKFHCKEDVQKLYGLEPALYHEMLPYITLPAKTDYNTELKNEGVSNASRGHNSKQIVELNSADSASLVALKGIGPVSARRILIYRSRLGGFASIEQLNDIYGIKRETIDGLVGAIAVDTSLIARIAINTMPVDTLAMHPYITLYQARAIVYYREKRGVIKSLEELVQNRILPMETAKKLSPYIRF